MKFTEFIENKQEITLGFIGGSLTYGSGPDDYDLSTRYTSRLVATLNKLFPEKSFKEVNAGVGGTLSAFGMSRLKKEVLEQGIDILFVEFTVNDSFRNRDFNCDMFKYAEGLVRAARRYNKDMPIMMLYTYPCMQQTMEAHKKIAEAYALPYSDIDTPMRKIIAGYGDHRILVPDGTHPNREGYSRYIDTIIGDLLTKDFGFDFPEEPIFGTDFKDPDLLLLADMECPEGWCVSRKTFWNTPYKYLCGYLPGASIEIEFEGSTCGVYYRIEKDGGILETEIDGVPYGLVQCWRDCTVGYEYSAYELIKDGLSDGKHTLKLTVSKTKIPDSEGCVCRVAAVTVGG